MALIEQAKQGNQLAFQNLVSRYENKIAAVVIGMLGYCPESEDVGQETFIRFYKSMHKFRGDANLGTYLTRIAINLSLNELKKRKRRRIFSFFSDTDDSSLQIIDPANKSAAYDTKQLVHMALQQLETPARSVVILRLIEGYSTKETAEILAIPTGTVLSRLSRAQQKLKQILEKNML